jgi:hypothetical protein
MVIHPYSPPMDYQTYPLQTYIPPQQSSLKRKREYDRDDFDVVETPHILKKQRDEMPSSTLPSPPSSLVSLQSFSPRSDQDAHHIYNSHFSNKEIKTAVPLSSHENQHTPEINVKPLSSDVESDIPSHNVFLRDVHFNSRTFLQNQKEVEMDKDEEMWEDEEEVVAERYAAMNKLLGSRRRNW